MKDRWSEAQSFRELCELGARFVEGRIDSFPGWGARELDAESVPLADTLARLNRAGFLTCASQPGAAPARGTDGVVTARRPFVTGFARLEAAADLAPLARKEGLFVVSWASDEAGGDRLPVGLRGKEPYLWAGHAAGREELRLFSDSLSPAGLAELERCRWVWAVDLEWKESERLWKQVLRALE